jgi:hypothetical protein
MASSGDVLKRRVWKTRFAGFRSSGLSVARFCEQEGVSTHTFYYWAKRLGQASAKAATGGHSRPWSRRPAVSLATERSARQGMVCFRWPSGAKARVPADCLPAIRCLAACLAEAGAPCGEAFQEVVVKA